MAPHCDFRLPGDQTTRVDLETPPRILALTANSEDGQLTRGLGRLMLAQARQHIASSSLVLFDLLHPDRSSFNPPDDQTRHALTLLFVRSLIEQGCLHRVDASQGRNRVVLTPDTRSNLRESGVLPFHVRPGNWQRALVSILRNPAQIGVLSRTGRPDAWSIQVRICPRCKQIIPPGRPCCSDSQDLTPEPGYLWISLAVQRMIWLVLRLAQQTRSLHSRLPQPSSILIIEPKLLSSHLNLFLQFLQHSGKGMLFRELVIWPPQTFPHQHPDKTVSRMSSDHAPLLVWPGWKSASQPPPGRQRYLLKMIDKWRFLEFMTHPQGQDESLTVRTQVSSTALDRWLLHSFNLMIASSLTLEENRRQALALDRLVRFVASTLTDSWLRWRRADWDKQSMDYLRTILPILESLLQPYGILPGQTASGHRSASPPILYREDWIYIREYKLVETALAIHRQLNALLSEIRKTGLEAKPRIGLCLSHTRSQPKELLNLLKRFQPDLDIEFISLARFKSNSGLKGQEGVWRLVLGIEDEEMRQHLRDHYERCLVQEQCAYDGYKQLYMAHKSDEGHLQSHLKNMRGKLLRLKRRQMITLSRIHELQ